MAIIDEYLREMLDAGGSDLHLSVDHPVKIRVHGTLKAIRDELVTPEYMREMLEEICEEKRWKNYQENHDLDFAYEIPGLARFRTNYFYNYHGQAAVMRQIPSEILTLEDLKLPDVLVEICELKSGLALVTGPTGSGKSTTLAAMIDYINAKYDKHIITIEHPVEFVHHNKRSIIAHREVGIHTESFARGLKGAMRSDPDILLIGELRDKVTMSLALQCASMGMLVFATLHTNNAPKTVDRIIDAFPSNEQDQVRTMLAECLQAVVSQLLCRTETGRIACHEILLWSDGLPNTIREGQISNIRTIIEGNKGRGMRSMDGSLMELLEAGTIAPMEAYMKANDKKPFIPFLKEGDIPG